MCKWRKEIQCLCPETLPYLEVREVRTKQQKGLKGLARLRKTRENWCDGIQVF